MFLAEGLTVFVGWAAGLAMLLRIDWFRVHGTVTFFAVVVFGVLLGLIPRTAFRRLIPATCPDCGGAAFPKTSGGGRVSYDCRDCGHSTLTRAREWGHRADRRR